MTSALPKPLREYKETLIPWGESRRLSDSDRDLAELLRNKGILSIDELPKGIRLVTNSRVGHVAFDAFDLVILPKFEQWAHEEGKISPLATLLAYGFGLDKLKIVGEQLSPEAFFADILVHWLLNEARRIQRRGLFRRYRQEHRDLTVVRGKIDMKTRLRRGGVPSESLPCEFYRRSFDNVLNQTLCAGLRRCVSVAKSSKLKSECRFLADTFALSVTEKPLDRRLIAVAFRRLNRLNAHYENAVRIVRMLYRGSGGFVHGEKRLEHRIPGFFFDMNELFEKTIERFLSENLPGFDVSPQLYSAIYSYDENDGVIGKSLAQSKPDIVVETPEKKRIVLDSKYKNIGLGEPGTGDLYQLSVYALACSSYPNEPHRRARILFPADPNTDAQARDVVLHRWEAGAEKSALCRITLQPVDMRRLIDLIDKGSADEKKKFALELIGEESR